MNPFPVPVRSTTDSAAFFELAGDGSLMLRQCDHCSALRAPQERFCSACGSPHYTPVAAQGTGRLITWTLVRRSPVPGIEAPYTVAVVECREGPWVLVRLLDADTAHLTTDTIVRFVTAPTGADGEPIIAARTAMEAN